MIAVCAVLAGLVVGRAAGGSLGRVSRLRLRGEVAILVTFVLQGIARGRIVGTSATTWGLVVWLAASITLVCLLGLNGTMPGVAIAAGGTLLNSVVVLANGAMPVLPAVGTHIDPLMVATMSGGFYSVAQAGTLGVWAGDVLPLRVLEHTYLLSAGDVLLATGVAVLIAASTLGQVDEIDHREDAGSNQ